MHGEILPLLGKIAWILYVTWDPLFSSGTISIISIVIIATTIIIIVVCVLVGSYDLLG